MSSDTPRQSLFHRFVHGTTTPLASIFGSGFLVIISLLADSTGPFSLVAIVAICAVAYAVGTVIRHNIAKAEPALTSGKAPRLLTLFERISDIALIPAYIISVTLYLRILSSYGLGIFGLGTEFNERVLTTIVIAFILLIEFIKGLKLLEGLERWSLITTLAIILLLIGSFAIYDAAIVVDGGITLPKLPVHSAWEIVTLLAGTLIVVQGFETTRYLGEEFDADTRIRASRNSQLISSTVYILFVAVSLPLMHLLGDDVSGNALIQLAEEVAFWLAPPLVLAAVFSQFSAATADAISASGNLLEISGHRLPVKVTYILICSLAILLTWTADTFQILALASRAFAFYYFLQCLVGLEVATKKSHKLALVLLAALLLFVTIFAVPVG